MLKVTNFKIILFVLLFIFLVDIRFIYGIHTVGDEEYKILLQLAKGTFSVPVKERNQVQKSAIVKFGAPREGSPVMAIYFTTMERRYVYNFKTVF